MHVPRKWGRVVPAVGVFGVALVGACADTGQLVQPALDAPLLAVSSTPVPGQVKVCKDATSGTFDFTASQNPTTEGTLVLGTSFSVNAGECELVWQDNSQTLPADPTTFVTVTETVPAGWQLDQIVVTGGPSSVPSISGNSATVEVNAFHGAVITFRNSELPPPPGDEGCTPGYWKNHDGSGPQGNSWGPTGYSPGQTVGSVFTGFDSSIANLSLSAALGLGGGPGVLGAQRILARAAVAALLNAAHPGVAYPLTTAQVISQVNAALATNNRQAILDLAATLDGYNNLGCPLGRGA